MDKISTSELTAKVADATGQTRKAAKMIIDELVVQIIGHVTKGQSVAITGMGKFVPVDRVARTCKSPLTGKTVDVPARRVLGFKGSEAARNL